MQNKYGCVSVYNMGAQLSWGWGGWCCSAKVMCELRVRQEEREKSLK